MKRTQAGVPGRRSRALAVLVPALVVFIAACARVPLTGRQQLNLIPGEQINSLAGEEYTQFISSHQASGDSRATAQVRRVGERIARAVEQFYASQGLQGELAGYEWQFNLIQDDQVNAFAMPGGKVVVYTGILPVTQNDAGLATVMGHEIAHVVARHGNERMSQALVVNLGGMALDAALKSRPAETRNLFLGAYGVGTQVGALLPFSRQQESEADHLGMIFMAMAGFDPAQAIGFWERMSAQGGSAPPEFLSTHPADERRIRDLQKLLPEAQRYYQAG